MAARQYSAGRHCRRNPRMRGAGRGLEIRRHCRGVGPASRNGLRRPAIPGVFHHQAPDLLDADEPEPEVEIIGLVREAGAGRVRGRIVALSAHVDDQRARGC